MADPDDDAGHAENRDPGLGKVGSNGGDGAGAEQKVDHHRVARDQEHQAQHGKRLPGQNSSASPAAKRFGGRILNASDNWQRYQHDNVAVVEAAEVLFYVDIVLFLRVRQLPSKVRVVLAVDGHADQNFQVDPKGQ